MQNYQTYFMSWLEERRPLIKESTFANYEQIATTHILPYLHDKKLSDISASTLQKLTIDLMKNGRRDGIGGLAEKTVKDIIMVIKLSIKDAIRSEIIPYRDCAVRYPSSSEATKPRVLSKPDQLKLTQSTYLNPTPKSLGILICLHTGIRIGELCAIKWGDIDFKLKTITISQTVQRIFLRRADGTGYTKLIFTTPKTKSSNRTIPLSSTVIPLLQKLRQPPEIHLLSSTTKPTEPRGMRSYYARYLKKLEIEYINFHSLRHTFATRLIESGIDPKTVSSLLGHSSVNTTLNLYVHPQMEQKRLAVEVLNELF